MSDKVVYSEKKGIKTTFCTRKRPKISQRRPLNRHELKAPDDLNASTSAKKLKQSEDSYDIEVNPAFGYRIINEPTRRGDRKRSKSGPPNRPGVEREEPKLHASESVLNPYTMADKTTTSTVAASSGESTVAVNNTPKKTTAKSSKPRSKQTNPKNSEMVNAAIAALKEPGGSSLQAIKKYIAGTYKIDTEKQATFIKKYLKTAVASGVLIQTKGKGAAGSFKLAKVQAVKPKAKLPAKAKAIKKVKPATKRSASPKKTAVASGKKPSTTKKTALASVSKKKKTPMGPAAKPPKPKTAKSKQAAKSPAKISKPIAPKKTKAIAVKPKKAVAAKK